MATSIDSAAPVRFQHAASRDGATSPADVGLFNKYVAEAGESKNNLTSQQYLNNALSAEQAILGDVRKISSGGTLHTKDLDPIRDIAQQADTIRDAMGHACIPSDTRNHMEATLIAANDALMQGQSLTMFMHGSRPIVSKSIHHVDYALYALFAGKNGCL